MQREKITLRECALGDSLLWFLLSASLTLSSYAFRVPRVTPHSRSVMVHGEGSSGSLKQRNLVIAGSLYFLGGGCCSTLDFHGKVIRVGTLKCILWIYWDSDQECPRLENLKKDGGVPRI